MIHAFKSCGISAAINSNNGRVYQLDSLMYSMLPYLPQKSEMTKELPISVRYAFAKYDSQDLTSAYRKLYDIYKCEKSETDTENSINNCVCVYKKSESSEFFKKIPDGSRVYVYVDSSQEAEKLKTEFSSLDFVFATDASLCEEINGSVAIFRFSDSEELIAKTCELFERGIQKVAGYPNDGISDVEALGAYDKLCRELVRIRKKGENGIFMPFAFEKVAESVVFSNAEKIFENKKGTFSKIYIERGQMPFNSMYLSSDLLIDKCTECAVVLSFK